MLDMNTGFEDQKRTLSVRETCCWMKVGSIMLGVLWSECWVRSRGVVSLVTSQNRALHV